MQEKKRLAFVEQRDGAKEAVAFAKRTMQTYRTCVLRSRKRGFKNPHHASLPEYRRGFIESYLVFKKYVFADGLCFAAAQDVLGSLQLSEQT